MLLSRHRQLKGFFSQQFISSQCNCLPTHLFSDLLRFYLEDPGWQDDMHTKNTQPNSGTLLCITAIDFISLVARSSHPIRTVTLGEWLFPLCHLSETLEAPGCRLYILTLRELDLLMTFILGRHLVTMLIEVLYDVIKYKCLNIINRYFHL